MTETQARQKLVNVLVGWMGWSEANGKFKVIIDKYNSHKPLARGYAVKLNDEWCCPGASAAAIEAGFTDIIPTECGCQRQIELWKKLGRWQENDAYVPNIGDYVYYDWQDGKNFATTDNTGWADHVGVVEKIVGSTITVVECNLNSAVDRRNLQVNGRYIRGYGLPDYASKADTKEETPSTELKVGDVVNFVGNKHYTSSYTGAKSSNCKGGKAKITAISKGKAHPYHLVRVSGAGSTVYGWVDAKDIAEYKNVPSDANTSPSKNSTIKVGDIVEYTGKVHYTSSYTGAKSRACKGGKAKVTAISKGKPHPYHLVNAEKGCTVYGWVDADKVSK